MVPVLRVLLHPLQLLLMTFETPGVVFDLRHHVALLQAEVENIWLLLHLISVVAAKVRSQGKEALPSLPTERLTDRGNGRWRCALT